MFFLHREFFGGRHCAAVARALKGITAYWEDMPELALKSEVDQSAVRRKGYKCYIDLGRILQTMVDPVSTCMA